METGSAYIKNFSVLHISGTQVGDNWFIGSNYIVDYYQEENKS